MLIRGIPVITAARLPIRRLGPALLAVAAACGLVVAMAGPVSAAPVAPRAASTAAGPVGFEPAGVKGAEPRPTTLTRTRHSTGSSDAAVAPALRAAAQQLQAAAVLSAGDFNALTPARLLDTRNGNGAPIGKIGSAGTLDLQVTGRGGVPAGGVAAVVLTVTATAPTRAGFLSVYPTGTPRPITSTVNFIAGQTISNLAVAQVSATGQVTIFNSAGTTDVVVDVTGWYAPTSSYTPVTPARVLDTRVANGVPGTTPVPANGTVNVTVAGRGGIPATGAIAVVLNVTVTGPTRPGDVSVFPAGSPQPAASSLNFPAAGTVANLTMMELGDGGAVSIFNHSAGTTHVIADVAGWYSAGGQFHPFAPERAFDTRTDLFPIVTGNFLDLWPTGFGSVPGIGVSTVVLNLTVVNPTANGFVTVHGTGTAIPTSSSLNYTRGRTSATLVVAKVGAGGWVRFDNKGGTVNMVVDVVGYYSADGTSGAAALAVGASAAQSRSNSGSRVSVPGGSAITRTADNGRYTAFVDPLVLSPYASANSLYIRDDLLGLTVVAVDGFFTPVLGDLSDDGRFMTISTRSADFWVDPDLNAAVDVFWLDNVGNVYDLVSANLAGAPGSAGGISPGISPNGRFVSFTSASLNLAAGQTPAVSNVFVRDLGTNTTAWVDACTGGSACTAAHGVSDDGENVVYHNRSAAGVVRALVWDRTAGTRTPLGSDTTAGQQEVLSADGNLAAFTTSAALTANDTNPLLDDVYVRDLTAGTLTLVSRDTAGTGAGDAASSQPAISATGAVVAFVSTATNLSTTAGNGQQQVFAGSATGGPVITVSKDTTGVAGNGTLPVVTSSGSAVLYRTSATNLGATAAATPVLTLTRVS